MEDAILKPTNDVFSELVNNVKGSNVDTTIVDGNILMENRELKNLDEKEIIAKASEIIETIK
jgi:5-methylthioadenosine/S-adenosylhomocysteine deaminase